MIRENLCEEDIKILSVCTLQQNFEMHRAIVVRIKVKNRQFHNHY